MSITEISIVSRLGPTTGLTFWLVRVPSFRPEQSAVEEWGARFKTDYRITMPISHIIDHHIAKRCGIFHRNWQISSRENGDESEM
jgi:hypothetical protein